MWDLPQSTQLTRLFTVTLGGTEVSASEVDGAGRYLDSTHLLLPSMTLKARFDRAATGKIGRFVHTEDGTREM